MKLRTFGQMLLIVLFVSIAVCAADTHEKRVDKLLQSPMTETSIKAYVPDDWNGGVWFVEHRPEVLPLIFDGGPAVMWDAQCGAGGVAPLADDDDHSCSSEGNCQTDCNEVCTDATGQGVKTEMAPGGTHIHPHPTQRNCMVCSHPCSAGGSCVITCCEQPENSVHTIVDDPDPVTLNPIPLCDSAGDCD